MDSPIWQILIQLPDSCLLLMPYLNNITSDRFAFLSVISHFLHKTLQLCCCVGDFLWRCVHCTPRKWTDILIWSKRSMPSRWYTVHIPWNHVDILQQLQQHEQQKNIEMRLSSDARYSSSYPEQMLTNDSSSCSVTWTHLMVSGLRRCFLILGSVRMTWLRSDISAILFINFTWCSNNQTQNSSFTNCWN